MKKCLYLVFIAFVCSCNNVKKLDKINKKVQTPEYLKSIYFDNEYVLLLKNEAIEKGIDDSFGRLVLYYSYNPNKEYELLSIAIVMAEKYNNERAYRVIYDLIIKLYNKGKYSIYFFEKLKNPQKDFAFYYLEKGAEENSLVCIQEIGRLYRYGIGVDKNIELAEKYGAILLKNQPDYDFKRADEYEMKNGL